MGIIFSEGSGLNNSVFGICQAPIRKLIEDKAEGWEKKSMLAEFFHMDTTTNGLDLISGMTAMDGFKPVGENGAYPANHQQEGYSKTLVQHTWKSSFAISKEAIQDSKTMDLKKKPQAFIKAYYRTRENFGAAVLGGAITGKSAIQFEGRTFDITCADGKPVFSTQHKPKIKGNVQSNLFSNEFSADALDRAEAAMQQFKGDNGDLLGVAPVTIAIANIPALKRKVFEVVGADLDPNSVNNGFNFQVGRWNIKVWNYLNQFLGADAEPWMLIDDDYNEENEGAVWYDRQELEVYSYIENGNGANVWNGDARFSAGFNDFRFACLGGVAGGTDLTQLKL